MSLEHADLLEPREPASTDAAVLASETLCDDGTRFSLDEDCTGEETSIGVA